MKFISSLESPIFRRLRRRRRYFRRQQFDWSTAADVAEAAGVAACPRSPLPPALPPKSREKARRKKSEPFNSIKFFFFSREILLMLPKRGLEAQSKPPK